MRISPKVIEKVSDEIVNRLEAENHVEYGEGKDEVLRDIREIIFQDIMAENELDAEVRAIIENNIDKFKEIPPHRMFSSIKRQLIKERKLII